MIEQLQEQRLRKPMIVLVFVLHLTINLLILDQVVPQLEGLIHQVAEPLVQQQNLLGLIAQRNDQHQVAQDLMEEVVEVINQVTHPLEVVALHLDHRVHPQVVGVVVRAVEEHLQDNGQRSNAG